MVPHMHLKWLLPVIVGMIMFANHYTRDSVGALEKELEKSMRMSPSTYLDLNSVYFLPNIATPLIAGMLVDRVGGVPTCFLYSTIIASLGYLVFSCKPNVPRLDSIVTVI
jgi:MFS family permease